MASDFDGRGGEMCDDHGNWKEELYWKHFKCLHFCQILPSKAEFHKHLLIPRKFADNARANLPQKVTLRGPGGASWCAIIATIGNDLFLSDGWEEFARAYSLQPNNILIFKYDGVSIFDVLIFDGENLCEKESAYFVKKCGHVDPSVEGKRKRLSCDDDVEENGEAGDERGTKQAREEVGKKAADEPKKVLRNTKSRSRGNAKKEKLFQRKSASSKASPANKVPTTPRNLAKSFEPGKSPIQNATSILGPGPKSATEGPHQKNTPRSNGSASTGAPAEYSTPSNGNKTAESPPQDAQRMNGSFPTETSPLSAKKVGEKTKATRGAASRRGRGRPSKEVVRSRGRKKASLSEVETNSTKKVASADKPASEMGAAEGAEDIDLGSPESYNKLYVSEAGKMALERARKEMTERSFVVIMRPTSVSRRFLLTVPPGFQRTHLAPKKQDVFLRIGDKTWLTRLSYGAGRTTGQICGGWKQFVQENQLEQFDVCLFKLVSQNEDSVMFDVGIFRAGPAEPAPPTEEEVDTPIRVYDGSE